MEIGVKKIMMEIWIGEMEENTDGDMDGNTDGTDGDMDGNTEGNMEENTDGNRGEEILMEIWMVNGREY